MSQIFRKYLSIDEVNLEAQKSQKTLVVYKDFVFDVTNFLSLHPGGANAIKTYKGRYIDNVFYLIFFNPQFHQHTQSSLTTLEKYKCGYIDTRISTPNKSITPITPKTDSKISNNNKSDSNLSIQLQQSLLKNQNTPQQVKKPVNPEIQNKQANTDQRQTNVGVKQNNNTPKQGVNKPKKLDSLNQSLDLGYKQGNGYNKQNNQQIKKGPDLLNQSLDLGHKQTNISKQTNSNIVQSTKKSANPDALNSSVDMGYKQSNGTRPFNKQVTSPTGNKFDVQPTLKKLNTSKTHFLMIPDPMEVMKQQKIKQARLMEEWKKKENEDKITEQKKTQSEILEFSFMKQKQKSDDDPEDLQKQLQRQEYSHNQSTQSEILAIQPKRVNLFYEQWKQSQQQNSRISQNSRKSNNYYEEWKKNHSASNIQKNAITEVDEDLNQSRNSQSVQVLFFNDFIQPTSIKIFFTQEFYIS